MFPIGNILGYDPGAGTVAIDANERVGRLRRDQFVYEGERVLDVVLQGHAEMWAAMRERDEIYADAEAGGDGVPARGGRVNEIHGGAFVGNALNPRVLD